MWAAKIIIPSNEGMLIGSRAKDYNVDLMGYPLSHFWKNNKFHILVSIYLIGEDLDKKKFLFSLKKDKRTKKIEMMDKNFGFFLIQQHPGIELMFDPLIIFIKPLIVARNGDYIFEIASWEKEKLVRVARVVQNKDYKGRLVSIQRKKIGNINIVSAMPKLTERQAKSLDLAIQGGYYNYPRKIEAKNLAKIMKVSPSTYQFHLRNAEKKVIPYVFQNISIRT